MICLYKVALNNFLILFVGRTPMMDLLVQITSAHRINPGGHVIQVMNDRSDDFLYYKPSTPIGKNFFLKKGWKILLRNTKKMILTCVGFLCLNLIVSNQIFTHSKIRSFVLIFKLLSQNQNNLIWIVSRICIEIGGYETPDLNFNSTLSLTNIST